jgi:hypothetical protein
MHHEIQHDLLLCTQGSDASPLFSGPSMRGGQGNTADGIEDDIDDAILIYR